VAQFLNSACGAAGIRFGTWAQGQPYAYEEAMVSAYGASFHIANVETRHEEQTFDVASFRQRYPKMEAAVIFTQAAFDNPPGVPDARISKRWRDAGFNALPEANLAENPGATIDNMRFLAEGQLKWPVSAPTVFVFGNTRASRYTPHTWWSIWRYGGMTDADWVTVRNWPRP
jgi:hypothetical protein